MYRETSKWFLMPLSLFVLFLDGSDALSIPRVPHLDAEVWGCTYHHLAFGVEGGLDYLLFVATEAVDVLAIHAIYHPDEVVFAPCDEDVAFRMPRNEVHIVLGVWTLVYAEF